MGGKKTYLASSTAIEKRCHEGREYFCSNLSHISVTLLPRRSFLRANQNERKDGGMKTLPQNIVPFVLRGLPSLNKLDQGIMRKLRKLADQTGSTVEDLIHEGILEFVAKSEAERELETKVVRFPKA